MKIFYLLFLVFLFMSCAERGNEEKKVMILGVTPEQIVELKGEELPIQELIPTSICRLDSFLVILNMEEEKIVRVYQADTYRFLGAFLEKGRGDDEVISCQEIWAAPWKGKMQLRCGRTPGSCRLKTESRFRRTNLPTTRASAGRCGRAQKNPVRRVADRSSCREGVATSPAAGRV